MPALTPAIRRIVVGRKLSPLPAVNATFVSNWANTFQQMMDHSTGFGFYMNDTQNAITGITKANPAVITIGSSRVQTRSTVDWTMGAVIKGVLGMTQANTLQHTSDTTSGWLTKPGTQCVMGEPVFGSVTRGNPTTFNATYNTNVSGSLRAYLRIDSWSGTFNAITSHAVTVTSTGPSNWTFTIPYDSTGEPADVPSGASVIANLWDSTSWGTYTSGGGLRMSFAIEVPPSPAYNGYWVPTDYYDMGASLVLFANRFGRSDYIPLAKVLMWDKLVELGLRQRSSPDVNEASTNGVYDLWKSTVDGNAGSSTSDLTAWTNVRASKPNNSLLAHQRLTLNGRYGYNNGLWTQSEARALVRAMVESRFYDATTMHATAFIDDPDVVNCTVWGSSTGKFTYSTSIMKNADHTGTLVSATSTTGVLAVGANGTTNYYNGALVSITSGTGAGTGPFSVLSYNGGTRTITLISGQTWTADGTSVVNVVQQESWSWYREVARMLQGNIEYERLGGTRLIDTWNAAPWSRFDEPVKWLLRCAEFFITRNSSTPQKGRHRMAPFMSGLFLDILIEAYTWETTRSGGSVSTWNTIQQAGTTRWATFQAFVKEFQDYIYDAPIQVITTIPRFTCTAGSGATFTLPSGASAVDSFYNNCAAVVISGTGAGQNRKITGYVGSTKVATCASAFSPVLDNTSVVDIYVAPNFYSSTGTVRQAQSNGKHDWMYQDRWSGFDLEEFQSSYGINYSALNLINVHAYAWLANQYKVSDRTYALTCAARWDAGLDSVAWDYAPFAPPAYESGNYGVWKQGKDTSQHLKYGIQGLINRELAST